MDPVRIKKYNPVRISSSFGRCKKKERETGFEPGKKSYESENQTNSPQARHVHAYVAPLIADEHVPSRDVGRSRVSMFSGHSAFSSLQLRPLVVIADEHVPYHAVRRDEAVSSHALHGSSTGSGQISSFDVLRTQRVLQYLTMPEGRLGEVYGVLASDGFSDGRLASVPFVCNMSLSQ
ncbi:hypothetical protein B0O80DRAFT_431933 [Mortierella sp. GBAus27b]|nr:hypothetical protein B0O80DRAFT_431933 [Mortierella sp. GBAus27b]